ncbi:MAG: hypothetical protein ACFBZ9_14185 [Sphingomonadales bacterium]
MLSIPLERGFDRIGTGRLVLEQLDETDRPVKLFWLPEADLNGDTPDLLSAQVRNETPDTLSIGGASVGEVSANLYTVPVGVDAQSRKYVAFNPVGAPGVVTVLLTTSDGVQEFAFSIVDGK